jgi:hypothetical protein
MLNISVRPSTRMDMHSEVAGVECVIAPLTIGAITLSGFREMFWRGCQSPVLANAITAWAIIEVIEDGLARFKDKPVQTVKQLQICTSAALVDVTNEPDNGTEELQEPVSSIAMPDFLDGLFDSAQHPDSMTVDTREVQADVVISLEFEFLAGRHTLNLAIENMQVPFDLLDKPMQQIASRIITGTIMHILDEMMTVAETYAEAFKLCENELKAMPGLEKLPKTARNAITVA